VVRLLPALVFLVAAGMSFATGTSRGTMAILIPLVIPLTAAGGGGAEFDSGGHDTPLLGTISSVLAGAIFGDHCSRSLPATGGANRVARYYLFAREPERALDWLERAFEQRDPSLPYLASGHKNFDLVRGHPRYRELLRRLNFPPERAAGSGGERGPRVAVRRGRRLEGAGTRG
jgi:hypothetical protein